MPSFGKREAVPGENMCFSPLILVQRNETLLFNDLLPGRG
jgi:hypothetical protein